MPHPVEPASISLRSWTWWLLAALVLLCALVATFNAIVDPTAQLGTGVLEPIAAGPRDRTAKFELLDRAEAPELVVLGSSRTKKLDPAWLETRASAAGVNAAVVGGDLFEVRVFTAWLAGQAAADDEEFPQLVVGIDVEQFRDSSLHGSGFLDLPKVSPIARREAGGSVDSPAQGVRRLGRLLLTMQVTKASIASLRARGPGARGDGDSDSDSDSDSKDEPTEPTDTYTQRGVPVSDRAWVGAQVSELASRTTDNLRANIVSYRATYEATGASLDEDAVDDLRAVVRIARDAGGPPPLLYVTPSHPRFVEELDPIGRAARLQRVVEVLDRVGAQGDAITLDCSSCIDGEVTSWIDGTHPSPLGMRQLADRLARAL